MAACSRILAAQPCGGKRRTARRAAYPAKLPWPPTFREAAARPHRTCRMRDAAAPQAADADEGAVVERMKRQLPGNAWARRSAYRDRRCRLKVVDSAPDRGADRGHRDKR